MEKFRRFATFLKIQPGEERVVGHLVLLAFILELAFVLILSMAFGIFLAEYGPQGLPYSYIVIAIFVSLAAVLYIKLGERVSFSKALMINLASLGIFSLLTWLGLKSPLSHLVAFLLPLLFQIVINLGELVTWQLAGHLFNFQQAKRLFPLLISAAWFADILGGLFIQPLVNWIGTVNLLLVATAFFGLAQPVLLIITRTYLGQKPETLQFSHTTIGTTQRSTKIFQNRYILQIFAYTLLWWVAFFLLDYIFSDRAAAQFSDVDQLTTFMGQLLTITGIVALISSTFLTSRIIGRFGLRAGLLGMPVLVTIVVVILALTGSLNGPVAIIFGLSTFAKFINDALGLSLSQTANVILYQSLPDTIRDRVQTTADAVVQPVANGIAGISLLGFTEGLKLNYVGLSYVFLGLAVVWLVVIFLLSGGYVGALTQVITKRRLGESPTVLADPASVTVLQSRLFDPHPNAAIYALNKLDELDSQAVASALPKLIEHPAPEVRREAFLRIEKLKLQTALNAVNQRLNVETIPIVKETALRALGAITNTDSSLQLSAALSETEIHSLRGALIGSLRYREMPGAEQVLNRLLASPSEEDRILAAQVLGEMNRAQFQEAHQSLLRDPSPSVRREALQSAGRSRQPGLYPLMIEACDSPESSHAAAQALISIGISIFPEVENAYLQSDAPRQRLLTLTKVIGRLGGPRAQALLLPKMDSPDIEFRSQVLNALSECNYREKNPTGISAAIKREGQGIAWICATQAALGNTDGEALLSTGLQQAVAQARNRILLLLSFVFDAHSMLRVREALHSSTTSEFAYALEIIDTQLPPEWKSMILPLFEDLSQQEQSNRLAIFFPQLEQKNDDRLRSLIGGSEIGQFTTWLRACAIHVAGTICAHTCLEPIRNASSEPDVLIRDTARWALARFSTDFQEGKNSMLSTIEKVLILKTVNMFSQTPDDVLADVANLLEGIEIQENETIFKQGEPGDSMYIIIDGKVRVHTHERLLNYLGESDVFGEMALLDPEPRLASVTAVEPTRLFRLGQTPFYQLMAERPEVATGIIRVLTKLLRDRVRDISQLDNHIKELEHASSGKV